jgi:hypothetical protein
MTTGLALLAAIRPTSSTVKMAIWLRKLDHEGALRQSQSAQAGAKLQQVLQAITLAGVAPLPKFGQASVTFRPS